MAGLRPSLRVAGLLLLVVVISGCASTASDSGVDRPVEVTQAAPDGVEDGPSALDDPRDLRLPKPLIDPDQLLSGGPPPDGIPAIDNPRFQRARDVDWLAENEAVLALKVGGESRAYPIQILTWHEIVNDTVAGIPVAVTYCPLCNSGIAFDRRVGSRTLTFGTSGKLYASNLVMYDRQTESLWPQLTGQASLGVLTGAILDSFPLAPVAWRDFRADNPNAWTLSRSTGFDRDYGRNPYVGYDEADKPLFDAPGEDPRLPALERIVAIPGKQETIAVVRESVTRTGVRTITIDRRSLVVWHRPGQASALERADVSAGRDIGTVAVFEPVAGGRPLTFKPAGAGFVDAQTGSRWNILGRATGGPLTGNQLSAYPFIDTFWFTWIAFQPDTQLIR
ncbi:uncharacterized protein DUF3179 [Kribbella sp. VKM Ac-2527]|uniref:Uncharacterized protein DUF3179 n=1 Tax=Kribbella caucasensis TaxID=2512215 RepID=A0A4R6JJD9_9ACTN|nr:DUF3179 domain-containing protein [Kribbella sp. VKM Ac-2527]TDO36304.1 uncharacterized protein DUF3179 [Kribbella sp. VKM Ac-2527]